MFRKLHQLFIPRRTAKVAQAVIRNVFRIESLEERLVPAIDFTAATSLNVGSAPVDATSADFNGDGKVDLAVANIGADSVSILLGNGTGGFTPAVNIGVGMWPASATVGDFNGDGKADLAVASLLSNNVAILLGNGSGGFQAGPTVNLGLGCMSIKAADFNADSKVDLAITNAESNFVAIVLGDGAGGFGAPTTFVVGDVPVQIVVGDFNNDSKLDLATANGDSDNISVLLGSGGGGFGPATNFAVGNDPSALAVGDFNGDGKLDLSVANYDSAYVSVFLGTDSGNFSAPTNIAVGAGPQAVVVADFDVDGKQDLVVTNSEDDTVSILKGTGTGTFTSAGTFAVGDNPIGAAVADFNNDGKPDIAAANGNANTVSLMLNTSTVVTAPTVTGVIAPNVFALRAGSTDYTFTIFYSGIAASTIGADDVKVTGPDGVALTVTSTVITPTGGASVAVGYIVSVPQGWGSALNGTYSIQINSGKVKNVSGIAVAAQTVATFVAAFETVRPTVDGSSLPNVGVTDFGKDSYFFSVAFSDDVGINRNSIGADNILVIGPDGRSWPVDSATIDASGDAAHALVTYKLSIPGGWRDAHSGVYTVVLRPNQVTDVAGNAAASQTLGSFSVASDRSAPRVTGANAANITQSNVGDAVHSFTVIYSDNVAIDWSTIGTNNVSVTNASGNQLSVISAVPDNASNGSPRTVTYTIAAPTGWTSAANGVYVIKTVANQVRDTAGNSVAASTLATFTVTVDTDAPTITSYWAPKVDASNFGQSTYHFTVTYADDLSLDIASFDSNDVKVFGPGGIGLPVTAAFVYPYQKSAPRTVDYTVEIPGGWNSEFNGAYAIKLSANEVFDMTGNAAASRTIGSFNVNIPVGSTAPGVTFSAYEPFAAGTLPQAVQTADLNRDGNLDLVVASPGSNSIVILPGAGDGSFGSAISFATNKNSNSVVVGDFNDDGILDLASASVLDKTVAVLIGDGNGGFSTALKFQAGDLNGFLAKGDFNNDGRLDLAVVNDINGSLRLFSGAGPSVSLFTIRDIAGLPPNGRAFTIADLDGDHSPDVALANTVGHDVTIVWGSGASPSTLELSNAFSPNSIVAADFDGDHRLDLAIGDQGNANILLLRGTGSGNFSAPTSIPAVAASDLIADDFNNDGNADLVLAGQGSSSFAILLGNGAGGFASPASYAAGDRPTAIATGDFNKDGKIDLVFTRPNRHSVSVVLNTTEDTHPPTVASCDLPNVGPGDAGKVGYTFTVVYSDDSKVDLSSIDVDNISVTGSSGQTLDVMGAAPTPIGETGAVAVAYTLAIPGGWSSANSGLYTVKLLPNQVKDASGNYSAADAVGIFNVTITNSAPIVAASSIPNVTKANTGATTYSFTVTFADDGAIDDATIGIGNVSVIGPGGASLAVISAVSNTANNGLSKTVNYTATTAGGWSDAIAGTYTVKVLGNQVKDTTGKAVAAKTLGSFTVDLTPPVIKSATVPAVTAANASQTTYSFTVSFTDNVLLNIGSVGVGNVSITGPGGQALTVLSATPNAASNGSSRNVTYTVAVPGGWNAQPAGTYAVKLLDSQVKDTAGNAVTGVTLGTLTIGADTVAPTIAAFSLPNVTQVNAGQTTYSFSITFADNVAINAATIVPANVTVSGPGGTTLAVIGVSLNAPGNGQPRTATYTVAVPGGWDASDLGTYTVKLLGGQVKDTAGNAVASKTLGTFTVDLTPPAIKSAVAKNVTGANAGQTTYSFTVSFTDNLLLNIASVSTANVSVTGPGGVTLSVTSATPNAASNGTSRTVTYTVAVPGGWKETNNGAYTIKLLPNQIKDTAGNAIVAQTITAFSVLIPPVVAAI